MTENAPYRLKASEPMVPVFRKNSVAPGDPLQLDVSGVDEGTHVEIQIFRVAVPNPHVAICTGAEIGPDGSATIVLDTTWFQPGTFELVAARTITRKPQSSPSPIEPTAHQVWKAKSPQERVLFEINESPRTMTKQELWQDVHEAEERLEQEFLTPVQAVDDPSQLAAKHFTAFVFVRGMLIGTKLRFRNCEIVPTSWGLEGTDSLNAVNRFLREQTRTGAEFSYSDDRRQRSLQANPVCVVHFPAVRACTHEEVQKYASAATDEVLLALALTRDASGSVFDCVVVEHGGKVISYTMDPYYNGNLLTGAISGENASEIERLALRLSLSPADRLLVSLYKDARSERSVDFQYVRFWAVLEALADAREYDTNAPLMDFEGNQIYDEKRVLTINGGVNSVYNLMRECGLGSTERNWRLINAWFAFRTATAHHGSRLNFRQLARPSVRAFAERAHTEIQVSGSDQYLWELKETTNMLLTRRLNRVDPWGSST